MIRKWKNEKMIKSGKWNFEKIEGRDSEFVRTDAEISKTLLSPKDLEKPPT